MSESDFIFFIVLVFGGGLVAFFVPFFIIRFMMKRKHLREYESLAREKGFAFSKSDDTITKQFTVLPSFKDSWLRVVNLLTGDLKGGRVSLFEAKLRTQAGHYTTCVVEDNNLNLPLCSISPKGEGNFFGAPGKPYGQECSLVEDQDFSSDFEVHGKDKSAIIIPGGILLIIWLVARKESRKEK